MQEQKVGIKGKSFFEMIFLFCYLLFLYLIRVSLKVLDLVEFLSLVVLGERST